MDHEDTKRAGERVTAFRASVAHGCDFGKPAAENAPMAKCKPNARYNILSIRVSDAELEKLEKLSRESNRKVSDLMREALHITDMPPNTQATGESSK